MPSCSIPVRLGPRSYSILVGPRLFPKAALRHPSIPSRGARFFVVADSRLRNLANRLVKKLGKRCAGLFFLRAGESTKEMASLPPLHHAAAQARLDRHSVVIALGGGVIGDVVGFFAATHLRGLRIVHIPTTLVAQVDSAIGGKTGVNLPVGKNLVGAFHQPILVIVDPALLKTLPEREFRSGLAEVVKYAVIADPVLFRRLELRLDSILRRDPAELTWVIRRCCAIKARVVSRDERETRGLRAALNFGHTIGHAIEAAAHYELLHGEAVALGMIGAVQLSRAMTGLSEKSGQRIQDLIQRAGLPIRLPRKFSTHALLAAMRLDKKAAGGQIRFVLTPRIGSVRINVAAAPSAIRQTLASLGSFTGGLYSPFHSAAWHNTSPKSRGS